MTFVRCSSGFVGLVTLLARRGRFATATTGTEKRRTAGGFGAEMGFFLAS